MMIICFVEHTAGGSYSGVLVPRIDTAKSGQTKLALLDTGPARPCCPGGHMLGG